MGYCLQTDITIDRLTLPAREVIGAKAVAKEEMLAIVSDMDYRPEEYRQFVTHEIMNLKAGEK